MGLVTIGAALVAVTLIAGAYVALTAAKDVPIIQTQETLRIPMAAGAEIYLGGLVCRDADGYAVPADDAEDYIFAGIAITDPKQPEIGESYDNSSGSDGDLYVLVRQRARVPVVLHNHTPRQDMLFCSVYAVDDQMVAVSDYDTDYDVKVGHIVHLPGEYPDPYFRDVDLASDEVLVQFSGEAGDWAPDYYTTTVAPTTTTTQA